MSENNQQTPTLLTAEELAVVLRTSRQAVYHYVYRGLIPRAAIVQRSKRGRLLFLRKPTLEALGIPGGAS